MTIRRRWVLLLALAGLAAALFPVPALLPALTIRIFGQLHTERISPTR